MSKRGLKNVALFVLSIFQYLNECHYTIKPFCSPQLLSDVYCTHRSPLPIFYNPLRQALCVSMCLGKTSFCTNWSQWHKLQGCVNKLCLHGNTYWQLCPLRSLQQLHWNCCIHSSEALKRGTLIVSATSCFASVYLVKYIKTSILEM